ncbi:MAG TPA: hypothetical protein VEP90_16980 [Methylomirabilota bacterium]|nr:hypothetical protein [Methylomirabilota bacterium]
MARTLPPDYTGSVKKSHLKFFTNYSESEVTRVTADHGLDDCVVNGLNECVVHGLDCVVNVTDKCPRRLDIPPQSDPTIQKLFDNLFSTVSKIELDLYKNSPDYYRPYHPRPILELRLNPTLIPLLSAEERDTIVKTAQRLGHFSDNSTKTTQ